MQHCSYEAARDPHLAAYYARSSVQKHLKRSVIAERLQRRPQHLNDFAGYMCAAGDAGNELALERNHVFQRFVALGEKHAAPSPLSPLLAQVAAQLQLMTASNTNDVVRSRSSSACDVHHRPAPPSAPGSRSSSRQSGPPSRPSSAGATRPPTGRSRLLASSRLPAAPPESLSKYRDPVSQHEKKVKFEDTAATTSNYELPQANGFRGRRQRQPSSSLLDYLSADTFDNPFVAAQSRAATEHESVDRVQISVAPFSRPTQSQQSRLDTPSHHTSSEPKTFVLVRFTIDQFVAAGKIQQWFRGSSVRKRNKVRKIAAARIQRAFRRFKSVCRTAFAVWMLEKDHHGRWHPTSKFAQLSERPTSARIRFSAAPTQAPSERLVRGTRQSPANDYTVFRSGGTNLVDFHGGAINNLGNVMALLVHEPQLRIGIVDEASTTFDQIVLQFVCASELFNRKRISDDEISLRSKILKMVTSSVRQLQARRSFTLLHDAGRQQLQSAESSRRVALSRYASAACEVFREPDLRNHILEAAHLSFVSIAADYLHFEAFSQKHQIAKAAKDASRHLAVETLVFLPKLQNLVAEESRQRDYIALGELSDSVVLEEKIFVMREIRNAVASIIENVSGGNKMTL
jgi:hypothetical protein